MERVRHLTLAAIFCLLASPLFAREMPVETPGSTLLRDTFYLSHAAKLDREVFEIEGFTLVPHAAPQWNSSFSVVTGFKGNLLTTHILKDVNSVDEARKYFQSNLKSHDVSGVNVRELTLLKRDGGKAQLFWVGNRAFRSLKDAKKSVLLVKKTMEEQGVNFEEALKKVREASKEPPPPEPEYPKTNPELEEEFAIKALDWLGFTEYLWGPLWGEPSGEKILYQSTFEGSYRTTNFDEKAFNAATAFWSHRIVFRGIRFIGGTTLDPFVDVVPAVQTDGRDFATNLEVAAGLEWRPFARSAVLQNYQPYGLPVLDWLRNFRAFISYAQKHPLKEKYVDDVKTHNMRAGVGLFKEWGVDMPSFDLFRSESPYVKWEDMFWGEVFSEAFYNQTNFSLEDDYSSIQTVFSAKVGIKWPRFPLPDNPINQELLFMPYFVFEDTHNYQHSFFFQNRFYYGGGLRWMPFRDYRFSNNEWLFKTKFFFEVLSVHYTSEKPASTLPEKDLRLGVNVSLRRF